jgi:ribonuclease R
MKEDRVVSERSDEQNEILGVLRGPDYRPLMVRELLRELEVPEEHRRTYRRAVRGLIRDGLVVRGRGNRLEMARSRPTAKKRSRGKRGTVLGVFRGRRGATVEPFDPSLRDPIPVAVGAREGARDGDAVAVEVRPARGSRGGEAHVVEVLGPVDAPGVDVRVVAGRYGLALEMPEAVEHDARALGKVVPESESRRRERFDLPAPVTIDGETAQDFDDAIAVRELPRGGFRLYVHIADVAHYVRPGGVLDREAYRRGTSVYFPGTVLPMLPEPLSNGLCSLRPGEDRLVQSVVLDFDREGHPGKVRFADGIIRSAARLTYTQVGALLDGKKRGHGVPGDLVRMLLTADRLRAALERRRRHRGSIDFDLPEPQILMDVEGVVTGVVVEPRNLAHRLIEEFMLAANEAVAGFLGDNEAACLYRIHERPDAAKVELLAEFVRGFGLDLRGGAERVTSRKIRNLLERAEGRTEYPLITQVALRTMQQARYSTKNIGHFSLAAPVYCHFTSPIRRYPDLEVHRLLRACRFGDERTLRRLGRGLERVADHCSTTERNAEAAERELLDWKKIVFMKDRVGDVFEGVVTAVTSFGLFVRLTETLVEGLVRIEGLGEEWFEWIESRQELRGANTGTTYRLGDRLRVRVTRVDTVLRRMDLVLEDDRSDSGRRSRGSGRALRRGRRRKPGEARRRGGGR